MTEKTRDSRLEESWIGANRIPLPDRLEVPCPLGLKLDLFVNLSLGAWGRLKLVSPRFDYAGKQSAPERHGWFKMLDPVTGGFRKVRREEGLGFSKRHIADVTRRTPRNAVWIHPE